MLTRLPDHGRYGYSPIEGRPHYSWPGGKRLAFHFATNLEVFAYAQGLGHTPTIANPPLPQPDQRSHAWRDYGLRVGVFHLLDVLDALALPASHLVNSLLYNYAPEILERVRARGDEIVGHGRTNAERQGTIWEEDEAALIREATETIRRHEGRPPRGWMSPWMSHSPHTPDLLKEAGYDFLMDWPADDQPFWMATRAGPILSVPYPIEINDVPQMLTRQLTAAEFAEMIVDQFEMMLELSEKRPLVMGIAVHPMIVGQPYRLRHLRRALAQIRAHPQADRVWFARPSQIADHVFGLPPGTVPFVPPERGWRP